ncbi:uncharacterized protein LOC110810135 [Carica papaya]|uniref:uncharacterized protein LOC110810135 n=1 Tax=Carica papaya TaxID=3649 RepID=UPI000B8C7759|nr:uncharacterized protein LOC110810135 [Carica papaya]
MVLKLRVSGSWLNLWNNSIYRGTPSFRLASKLKKLKEEITVWVKEVDRVENGLISDLMKENGILDKQDGELGLSATDRERRNNLKLELASKLNLEAISWKQNGREKWLKEGDKNTKYFHCLANYRRSINYVEELFIDNSRIEGNNDMRDSARNCFQNLFTEDCSWRPKLDNCLFNRLDEADVSLLEAEFSEMEAYDCLMSCEGDKAPSLDGFNTKFLQLFWGVVKKDIMDFFMDFHKNSSFVKSLNAILWFDSKKEECLKN